MPKTVIYPWDQVTDDDLVRTLINTIQHASVQALAPTVQIQSEIELPAPEMTTTLLNLLASVLETAPVCQTPADMRRISEAAGKELLMLMRGVREMKRLSAGGAVH